LAKAAPLTYSLISINNALSEKAVMSYEYGYSIDDPNNFSIW